MFKFTLLVQTTIIICQEIYVKEYFANISSFSIT